MIKRFEDPIAQQELLSDDFYFVITKWPNRNLLLIRLTKIVLKYLEMQNFAFKLCLFMI